MIMEEKTNNVAIDGPAGTGKSTVSKLLAKKLGFLMFDTGATYRAVSYGCIECKTDLTDEAACTEIARKVTVEINKESGEQRVFFDGKDCTPYIRSPEVTKAVSQVATKPAVRSVMVNLQKATTACGGFVAEGRDIGTVVFPNAKCKFYLDASLEIRTQRRLKQMQEDATYQLSSSSTPKEPTEKEIADLRETIALRDEADKKRAVGPLVAAPDAIVIDTGSFTIDQTVEELYKICVTKLDIKSE
ncbi:UMP/CMP kinase [Monocercomonoides exilis]|uniref:UMP/CMP kinase n=1 Tax=Monocercomonoides exilis TaxID=2049356 RepID=UPI003559CB95|nr:UMP/CMP kinase [Monocercomonoides exilis]|eukprot:MONOS_7778.1-p1 / transcript=MONOS_7778.1 / gene=MONOS_7778 / organism=Monocercomonoides_exilis_PA203 / gene_product=UMP/CMP kinase [EC:2.7.4.14] / transcript_product=UMP/CMP kinase [EC:2.7.4.14] / location=Mono_scaffold00274:67226-68236(+) / protein_length=245 / sequence_SO=supercontig / SO=protein_coding / is_pseudo=false